MYVQLVAWQAEVSGNKPHQKIKLALQHMLFSGQSYFI
jgi:hypothetical protein